MVLDFTGLLLRQPSYRTPAGTATSLASLSSTSRSVAAYSRRLDGGLVSFGPNVPDASRTAARLLHGGETQQPGEVFGRPDAVRLGQDGSRGRAGHRSQSRRIQRVIADVASAGAATAVQALRPDRRHAAGECWLRLRSARPRSSCRPMARPSKPRADRRMGAVRDRRPVGRDGVQPDAAGHGLVRGRGRRVRRRGLPRQLPDLADRHLQRLGDAGTGRHHRRASVRPRGCRAARRR